MNNSLNQPSAEVLLRLPLSRMLDADDLGRLDRLTTKEGSLDAAVIKAMQTGLADEERRSARKAKGARRP